MRHLLLPFFIAALDIIGVGAAFFSALFLRFDGNVPAEYFLPTIAQLPVFILIVIGVHCVARLYTRVWRYAGSAEGISVLLAIIADASLWVGFSFFTRAYLPRSIYVMAALVLLFWVGGVRFALRIYAYIVSSPSYLQRMKNRRSSKVLIWGAGDAGAMLVREIFNHPGNRKIIGIIDDDPAKKNSSFLGIKILGGRKDLQRIIDEYEVAEIFIAMPSVKGKAMREIVNICRKTGIVIKTLPGVYDLLDGMVVNQLRPVEVEDLLGRPPVRLEAEEVKAYLQDKVLLVTGAGGSIGSEICRQVAKMQPKKLLLLGKGENSIYEINNELQAKFPEMKKVPIIADVRDRERIREVLRLFQPQVIFHAAAHKHVPLMEYQPIEAVRNNILGTRVMAEEANRIGVEKFVMISTDKAVNPTNVMGCTKRIAEMFIQSMNAVSTKTKYAAVRFGNVLGSRGSVIPLFKKQIAAGGPVTVTDPEMKRYFMTIPEASQLVLQAGGMAKGGEVFVLDMGEPVKILDLAKDLISLSGFVPDEDIKIEFSGLRPGEKLFEELLSAEDGTDATSHEKIFTARIKEVDNAELTKKITVLAAQTDEQEIIQELQRIVPTYHPNHHLQ